MEDFHLRRMSLDYAALNPFISPLHELEMLEAFCEGLVRMNQIQIAADPDAYPCCIGCGGWAYVPPENCRIRSYKGSIVDPNCQHVRGIHTLNEAKRGTCIDLACALCAILRVDGDEQSRVSIELETDALGSSTPGRYHAVVLTGDGRRIDPQLEAQRGGSSGCLSCKG